MTDEPKRKRGNYWEIAAATHALKQEHIWRYDRREVTDLRPVTVSEINGKSAVSIADDLGLHGRAANKNVHRSMRFFQKDKDEPERDR